MLAIWHFRLVGPRGQDSVLLCCTHRSPSRPLAHTQLSQNEEKKVTRRLDYTGAAGKGRPPGTFWRGPDQCTSWARVPPVQVHWPQLRSWWDLPLGVHFLSFWVDNIHRTGLGEEQCIATGHWPPGAHGWGTRVSRRRVSAQWRMSHPYGEGSSPGCNARHKRAWNQTGSQEKLPGDVHMCYPCVHKWPLLIYDPDLFSNSKPQSNCLLDSSTWMSHEHLKCLKRVYF